MPPKSFLDLPFEIREMIYDALVEPSTDPKRWLVSREVSSFPTISAGNTYLRWLQPWTEPGARWQHKMISLRNASTLMATCHQVHSESAEYIYSRIIWIVEIRVDAAPIPPHHLLGRNAGKIKHYWVYLYYALTVDMDRMGFAVRTVCNPESHYALVETSCTALALRPTFTSLQIDMVGMEKEELVQAAAMLAPLRGRFAEIKVGRLLYRHTWLHLRTTSEPYQKMREVFDVPLNWTFPYMDAQYKD